MLKKTIKYIDYNGTERVEDKYFNLNKVELAEWDIEENGGLASKLQAMVEAKDMPEVYRTFKKVLKKSYGVKSEDGRRFIKNDELWTEFEQSEAYNELITSLLTGGEEQMMEFINGLANIKDIEKEVNKNN